MSRRGVSLEVVDGVWTVINRSASMRDLYLFDVRYGRRPVPPAGSLRLQRLWSWLLLPSSRGPGEPHVIAVAIDRPPAVTPAVESSFAPGDPRPTEDAGAPCGKALVEGLRRARTLLEDRRVADLLGAYARSYFAISTAPLEPATHRQVAECLPGDPSRGERMLTQMRSALWRQAQGQPPDLLIEVLIRHGVLTHDHVRRVVHTPACGHTPDEVDPTARGRRTQPLRVRS